MRRVPPPAERVAHLRVRRLMADAAVHRGNTDAPEGLIARARRTLAGVVLAGFGARHGTREFGKARHDAVVAHQRRAGAAGGIDIDVRDAAAVEGAPMGGDIPCPTTVAPPRIAQPEADAQSTPPPRRA